MNTKVKALFAALCAIAVLGFASCTKSNEELIIGTWNAVESTHTTVVTGMGPEIDGTESDTTTFKEGEAGFIFNADNTFESYSIDEETGEKETETGTYTVNDNEVTITIGGQAQKMTIVELNKKELTLRLTIGMSQGEASINLTMDIRFKKAN